MNWFKKKEVEVTANPYLADVDTLLDIINFWGLELNDLDRLGDLLPLNDIVDPLLFYSVNGKIKYPK